MSDEIENGAKEHTHRPEEIRSGEWKKKTFYMSSEQRIEAVKKRQNCKHKNVIYNFTQDYVECRACKYRWDSVGIYKAEKKDLEEDREKDAKQKY